MTRNVPPCRNCTGRTVGCHAKCAEYGAYRAEKDAEKDARCSDGMIRETQAQLVWNTIKRAHKRR